MITVTSFDVMIPADADADEFEQRLAEEITKLENVSVNNHQQKKTFGLTGAELAIAFGVSLAAGLTIELFRPEVEAAIGRVRAALGVDARVEFEEDDEDDSTEPPPAT